jgi:hypothetical protein
MEPDLLQSLMADIGLLYGAMLLVPVAHTPPPALPAAP